MTAAAITLTATSVTASYDSQDPCEHGDLDLAITDLHELRELQAALKFWDDLLSTYISDALGRNDTDVEGVGHVTVKRSTDRKEWDRRLLIRAVLDSHARPNDDGEVAPSDEGMAEVSGEPITCSPDLSRVLHVWNLGAPRVTALKERGIDPGEFCQSTPGRVSVVIE